MKNRNGYLGYAFALIAVLLGVTDAFGVSGRSVLSFSASGYCAGDSWTMTLDAGPYDNERDRLIGVSNDKHWEMPLAGGTTTGVFSLGAVGRHTLQLDSPGWPLSSPFSFEVVDCGGVWRTTGSLNTARLTPTATRLANGKVLVTGGGTDTAEIYDPATQTWSLTGKLATDRSAYTATLLRNGKVLVAGGFGGSPRSPLNSVELYDPETETWSVTGNLNAVRHSHTATLLPNGQVLVSAGDTRGGDFGAPPMSEQYDPGTGTWRETDQLPYNGHLDQRATLLPNGKVLLVGGIDNRESYPSLGGAALYDPATETWKTTRSPNTPRAQHTATLLPNGKVLVYGGFIDLGLHAPPELYDPETENWSPASALDGQRSAHTATLLPNGKVLLVGNVFSLTGARIYGSWSYNPGTGTWSDFIPHNADYHTATMLPNGRILMMGGWRSGAVKSAELFDGGFETPLFALNSTTYCVGNPWELTVTRAAHSSSVHLMGVSNGAPWEIARWGATGSEGNYEVSGTMAAGTEGAHSLRVEVGGVWSDPVTFGVANCKP